jgi:hypothetical protein
MRAFLLLAALLLVLPHAALVALVSASMAAYKQRVDSSRAEKDKNMLGHRI